MRLARAWLLALPFLLTASISRAGQIWTDGNGDGLPDPGPFMGVAVGAEVIVDIWIDSQSFVWTHFQAWVERDSCLSFVRGFYNPVFCGAGGCPPIDTFSNPHATGFAGFGQPNLHGVLRVAELTLRKDLPGTCCVHPIIVDKEPYGTFSVLGTQSSYFLFQTAGGTCWAQGPTATQPTSWGQIKGIHR